MSVDRIDVSAAEKIINQMGLVFAGNQISFSNLKYSQSGFQLDMFIVSNEKIWLMGPNGQREKLRKDFSAVSLFRFELAQRKSTNAVTGCFRFISASGKQVAAEAIISGIYDIRIEDDVLKFYENQALYSFL